MLGNVHPEKDETDLLALAVAEESAMPVFAIFGIDNGAVNTAINLLILVLVVMWLALVYWTYADARRRIRSGPSRR